MDRAVRRMKVELEERRKLIAMLRDKGAKPEEEERVVGILRDEWLSKGRPQSDAGNITWSAQDERKEMLHKIRRNWCLPIGQVFDMRIVDALPLCGAGAAGQVPTVPTVSASDRFGSRAVGPGGPSAPAGSGGPIQAPTRPVGWGGERSGEVRPRGLGFLPDT